MIKQTTDEDSNALDDTSADQKRSSTPEEGELDDSVPESQDQAPPLPDEPCPPPLPKETPPGTKPDKPIDDGWEACWDTSAQAFFFFNRFTQVTQWDNPRVQQTLESRTKAPGTSQDQVQLGAPPNKTSEDTVLRYNPAIHGDFDPTAPYATQYNLKIDESTDGAESGSLVQADGMTVQSNAYEATGAFNRFTGKWQDSSLNPENHNDENKSRRQMSAYFDVDAAANRHDGRSLRAERAGKKHSKQELKAFKEKRKEKKEEKRRAWLKD